MLEKNRNVMLTGCHVLQLRRTAGWELPFLQGVLCTERQKWCWKPHLPQHPQSNRLPPNVIRFRSQTCSVLPQVVQRPQSAANQLQSCTDSRSPALQKVTNAERKLAKRKPHIHTKMKKTIPFLCYVSSMAKIYLVHTLRKASFK